MDYKEMLEKARKELPKSVLRSERFEVPRVLGHVQGNKTIISNFQQIVQSLRRDKEHVLKFLLKELATPGEITNSGNLILGRKIGSAIINQKIELYTKEFVICPECKRPDTELVKDEKVTFIQCQACGAKKPVKMRV